MTRSQNLGVLKEVALYALYQFATRTSDYVTALTLQRALGAATPERFIEAALNRAEQEALVHQALALGSPTEYQITESGIEYVQAKLRDTAPAISQFQNMGSKWLEEEYVERDEVTAVIPASDVLKL